MIVGRFLYVFIPVNRLINNFFIKSHVLQRWFAVWNILFFVSPEKKSRDCRDPYLSVKMLPFIVFSAIFALIFG